MNLKLTTTPVRMGKGISLIEGNLKGNELTGIGIDPGVNFGMTIINREYIQIFYGKIPTDSRVGFRGISAYNYVMNSVLKEYNHFNKDIAFQTNAIVEGASYKDRFGQVGLEEVRFGFFFALYNLGMNVSIVPPSTIRKFALGHGRETVGDRLPTLNHNAADSIGCALMAVGAKDVVFV